MTQNPTLGFNYPYFLYAPDRVDSDPEAPLLVEPNNTGKSTDDFDEHIDPRVVCVIDGTLYGQRALSEAVFSVIKRPLGDAVCARS
ncbi:hypothetical protein GCM10009647_046980 [Streptomyces sanglieri]